MDEKTATVVVKDECNCKIVGLDVSVRKLLVNKFKYKVPNAHFIPAVKLGRWDGMKGYFALGGSTYINLLPEILPIIMEEGYEVDLKDERPDRDPITFEEVDANSYSHVKWPEGHPHAGQPIILRDYQVEIINGFFNNTQSIQEVATGAGKTLITAVLSNRAEKYGRSLVIVPSKSLVKQTEADYKNLGLDVGVLFGERKDYDKTHTICTWQSLASLLKKSSNHEAPVSFDKFIENVNAVIVDEVHGAKAELLETLLTGSLAHVPIRWGLTGTIPKEPIHQVSLLCSIGPIINKLSAKELQEKGVLAACHVKVQQFIDIKEFRNYQSELKYLLTDDDRQWAIAAQVIEAARSGNTLVLIDRVQAGRDITTKIQHLQGQMGVPEENMAVFVHGQTRVDKRQEEYDEIKTSTGKIIVATYGVAAVGIDMPRIFNLVLVEPGKSFVRVIQSIGRGIRKAQDKDFVQIWDVTSTCKYSKRHLTERKRFYREAEYPFEVEKVDWQ